MASRGAHQEAWVMRVLLDTNVLLDALLDREPWSEAAAAIWTAHDEGRLEAWITASSLTDIFYIGRRIKGHDVAREAVRLCLATFNVCPVDAATLQAADRLLGEDFEDNLQIACALASDLDGIVTRDPSDFAGSPIRVLAPSEVLDRLASRPKS
jgi:predicted nucleic acid-binding protein